MHDAAAPTDQAARPAAARPAAARSVGRAPIIAREGWPIIAVFAGATLALSLLIAPVSPALAGAAGSVGSLLTLWTIWFFRDPERATPAEAGALVSPADGVVVGVSRVPPPGELGFEPGVAAGMTRVSVFMNVLNVHVNRAPEAGVISRIAYRPGAYFNASLDKASELNERCAYRLELDDGRAIAFVQIAGLVARRIVRKVEEGRRVARGERIGLIRFGSRVDVYLPEGIAPAVRPGDRTVAGVTIVGRAGGAAS